jgi:SAM-dependent methyltransferase
MNSTGERMVPEKSDARTFWEHIYRYRFAAKHAKHKRVLDIACGEGYGSAALVQAGAKSLIGVDISPEACAHARQKYHIDARVGDALDIPVDTKSIDLVVSYETIEHVSSPSRFIAECVRVLAPGGQLIVSTPNRDIYHEIAPNNPFHCSEMTESEFIGLLASSFSNLQIYAQCITRSPWWSARGIPDDRWFWKKIRGAKRLTRFLQRCTCPHILEDTEMQSRRDPIKAILRPEAPLATLANPFFLSRYKHWTGAQPTYLIAHGTVCENLRDHPIAD